MPVFNQSRQTVIRLIVVAAFLILLVRLFTLQVLSKGYQTQAMDNAVYKKVIYPDRGIIYDRKARPILSNTIIYDLMVTPAEVKNIDTAYLCNLVGIDTAEFHRRIVTAIFKNKSFRPSVFEDLLPPGLQAKLEENIWRFPGFTLVERPIRNYPSNVGAHILGYIGEVDSNILRRSNFYYQLGDYVGRAGLEATYERVLMGQRGTSFLIKDNKNRIQGSFENGIWDTAAIAGRNLKTSLDVDLQQLAEKLMKNKVGAIVAIEPKTGGILAMTSGPDYSPNDLTGPDKQKNYSKLVLDVSGPLLNRAIKGQYPPGSTFKPLGGLVALDEGVITADYGYPCNGAYRACTGLTVKCEHSEPGHAANLRLAMAHSCNSYFSHVFRLSVDNPEYHSTKVGLMKWKNYMNAFGLGHRLEVDLPSEDMGNIPDSTTKNKEFAGRYNSCSMVTLGIGQDRITATPLQLANAMCIIANKGFYYVPHFVEKIEGEKPTDTILNKYRRKHEVLTHVSDAAFESIILGMQDVVESGTAVAARIPGIDICAKTGTAQNRRVLDGRVVELPNNSMFVCFAPREDPKIAIAVVVENAGFGATWAAPIGSLLVEKYLNDTLRPERVKKMEEIAAKDLMPSYLIREQFKADSMRAQDWFKRTNDSNYIKKFLHPGYAGEQKKKQTDPPPANTNRGEKHGVMDDPRKTITMTKKRASRLS